MKNMLNQISKWYYYLLIPSIDTLCWYENEAGFFMTCIFYAPTILPSVVEWNSILAHRATNNFHLRTYIQHYSIYGNIGTIFCKCTQHACVYGVCVYKSLSLLTATWQYVNVKWFQWDQHNLINQKTNVHCLQIEQYCFIILCWITQFTVHLVKPLQIHIFQSYDKTHFQK